MITLIFLVYHKGVSSSGLVFLWTLTETFFFITINSSVQPISHYYRDFRLSHTQSSPSSSPSGSSGKTAIILHWSPQFTFSWHFINTVLHVLLGHCFFNTCFTNPLTTAETRCWEIKLTFILFITIFPPNLVFFLQIVYFDIQNTSF